MTVNAKNNAPLVIRAPSKRHYGDLCVNDDELYYLGNTADVRVGRCDEGQFYEVAIVTENCNERDEAVAYANLFAAAPEMLKALQMLLVWEARNLGDPMKPSIMDVTKAARAAILAATGAQITSGDDQPDEEFVVSKQSFEQSDFHS